MTAKRTAAMLLAAAIALMCLCAPALAESSYAQTPLGASSENKIYNIEKVARTLSGWVLLGGETFSFNEAVGPRSAEAGYRNAENGRGAKVRGGGAAQAATTLYLAVRDRSDIAVEEFRSYGSKFSDGYVDDPDDAVLVDYNAGTDFTFTNLGGTLVIEMWTDGDSVCCSVNPIASGTPAGKTIASAATYADGAQARRENIALSASAVSGTVLEPGEEFSFNDTVGPRRAEYGYQNAVNGRGVKVRGGGVAQTASTLYLAAKQIDGLTMTAKRTYGDSYNQSYVADPDDAIVTDYGAGIDFAFRNDTGERIEIVMDLDSSGFLRCEILTAGEDESFADWDDGFDWNEDDWFFDGDDSFDEGDGQWVLGENGEWIWESAWEWIE